MQLGVASQEEVFPRGFVSGSPPSVETDTEFVAVTNNGWITNLATDLSKEFYRPSLTVVPSVREVAKGPLRKHCQN